MRQLRQSQTIRGCSPGGHGGFSTPSPSLETVSRRQEESTSPLPIFCIHKQRGYELGEPERMGVILC